MALSVAMLASKMAMANIVDNTNNKPGSIVLGTDTQSNGSNGGVTCNGNAKNDGDSAVVIG